MKPTLFMGIAVAFFFATPHNLTHAGVPGSETIMPVAMEEQRDRLRLENQLGDETVRKELAPALAELARLKAISDLERLRSDRELAQARLAIEKAHLEAEQISARLALETIRRQDETRAQLATLKAAKEHAELEADLASAEFQKRSASFKAEEVTWSAKLAELRAKISQRQKEEEADSYAEQRPIYLKEPLTADGQLVLSDRRIPLNGPITMSTADSISARIDYFNNKTNEFPIFIVIDDCPGGSVMAGYKIIKSMQSSTAPVYVVVKSFAASMAAAICALAERSFAYPNAMILHHQISNATAGNLTEQRERVKTLEQWWDRLAMPIATKMGITPMEFVQAMYAHSATGDWREFADGAAKLKWVDHVIGRCRETACVRNPDSETAVDSKTPLTALSGSAKNSEVTDEKGRAHLIVPRLNPVDCYFLYNPDGYYRME